MKGIGSLCLATQPSDEHSSDVRIKAEEILADYDAGRSLQIKGDGWLVRMSAALLASETRMGRIRSLSDMMAEDAGLWFIAQTAAEAYLQQEMRKLCALIEHKQEGASEALPEGAKRRSTSSDHLREALEKILAIAPPSINASWGTVEEIARAALSIPHPNEEEA